MVSSLSPIMFDSCPDENWRLSDEALVSDAINMTSLYVLPVFLSESHFARNPTKIAEKNLGVNSNPRTIFTNRQLVDL